MSDAASHLGLSEQGYVTGPCPRCGGSGVELRYANQRKADELLGELQRRQHAYLSQLAAAIGWNERATETLLRHLTDVGRAEYVGHSGWWEARYYN